MRAGRPVKKKVIRGVPQIQQFSPRGRPGRPAYVDIKFEEYEAIRLADFELLGQAAAAQSMGISQQTFSRLLKKARNGLAKALIEGSIIRLAGGDYRVIKGK